MSARTTAANIAFQEGVKKAASSYAAATPSSAAALPATGRLYASGPTNSMKDALFYNANTLPRAVPAALGASGASAASAASEASGASATLAAAANPLFSLQNPAVASAAMSYYMQLMMTNATAPTSERHVCKWNVGAADCGQTFATSEELIDHLWTHVSVRPTATVLPPTLPDIQQLSLSVPLAAAANRMAGSNGPQYGLHAPYQANEFNAFSQLPGGQPAVSAPFCPQYNPSLNPQLDYLKKYFYPFS